MRLVVRISFAAAFVAASLAVGIVRVVGRGLVFVPEKVAWALIIIPSVFTVLAVLSAAWNRFWGEPIGERNVFDVIADIFAWLPWP